jgi:hypothetical protein
MMEELVSVTNKRKSYLQAYRIRNKDKKRISNLEYYRQNKTKSLEYDRLYRGRNKDLLRESKRVAHLRNRDSKCEFYVQNRANLRETQRSYYVRNPENPATYSPRSVVIKSWKTPESVREYFDSIAEQLHISDYVDWYRVSRAQIASLGGV